MTGYKLKQPIPVLEVSNLKNSLQFYVECFGFQNPQEYSEIYGAVERDGMYLHFQQKQVVIPCLVYNYVEGVDEIYEHVKSFGAEILGDITDQHYGMRDFFAKDLDGNTIAFSQSTG